MPPAYCNAKVMCSHTEAQSRAKMHLISQDASAKVSVTPEPHWVRTSGTDPMQCCCKQKIQHCSVATILQQMFTLLFAPEYANGKIFPFSFKGAGELRCSNSASGQGRGQAQCKAAAKHHNEDRS